MKYELIKEYPGSPELGTIATPYKNSCDKTVHYTVTHPTDLGAYLAISKKDIETNPDYWAKVNENLWWCVWEKDYIQDKSVYFKSWTPCQIECIQLPDLLRHYFKTKKEAEEFIEDNKPCLSYSDLIWRFPQNVKKNRLEIDIDDLLKLIKSKL